MLIDTGLFKTLIAHGEDSCRRLPGPPGMEDLVLFRTSRGKNIILSGSDARERWFGSGLQLHSTQSERIANLTAKEQGGIYALNLDDAEPRISGVNINGLEHPDFHPHGLSIRKSTIWLFSPICLRAVLTSTFCGFCMLCAVCSQHR